MRKHGDRAAAAEQAATKRVLLVGPYGGMNLGDELIQHQIAADIQAAGHEVVVTSLNPEWTRAWHGVEAVGGFDPRRLELFALRHVTNVDAVVIGGGEQLQESASGSPLWGLLANVAAWTAAARLRGKPVMLWAVGVDRLATPWGQWMARRVCRSAAAVTVRDPGSRGRLHELGCEVDLVADPVFRLPRERHESARRRVWELLGREDSGQPLLLLSLANDRRVSLGYIKPLLAACRSVAASRHVTLVLSLMDRRQRYDQALLQNPELAGLSRIEVTGSEWVADLRKLHAGVDLVVSSRMHPLILAASQGTPWLNIARGEKMRALAEMIGRPAIELEHVERGVLQRAITEALDLGRIAWRRRDDPRIGELQSAAGRPIEKLNRLLASRPGDGVHRPREAEVGQ